MCMVQGKEVISAENRILTEEKLCILGSVLAFGVVMVITLTFTEIYFFHFNVIFTPQTCWNKIRYYKTQL